MVNIIFTFSTLFFIFLGFQKEFVASFQYDLYSANQFRSFSNIFDSLAVFNRLIPIPNKPSFFSFHLRQLDETSISWFQTCLLQYNRWFPSNSFSHALIILGFSFTRKILFLSNTTIIFSVDTRPQVIILEN